mgnify:CR=1 FL=1
MPEAIRIIQRRRQSALAISASVGTFKLGKVMGPAYESIQSHLKKNNIIPGNSDIPFTVYRNIDWEHVGDQGFMPMIRTMFIKKWDLEIGIPCPESTPVDGEIQRLVLEEGNYASTIHSGPYRTVGETYTKIQKYVRDQKLGALKNYSIEFYLNDPRKVSQEDLRTEVLVPIIS